MISSVAVALASILSASPSLTSCNATAAPDEPFIVPSPYPDRPPAGNFWHGQDTFWTMLRADGNWSALPRNSQGLRQKVFWWAPGFDGRAEPRPNLVVSGRQLDGTASFVDPGPATNAHHADFGGWAILTGIDVPQPGCWELTGHYRDQALTFVVWVAGEQPD